MLKIAVCDDECNILEDLKVRISKHMSELKIHTNIFGYSSGIAMISTAQHFDIIIMDIKMAIMDGMEVVKRLRAKGSYSQVIFVTSSKDYVFQAFDVDAVHYLVKPVSDKELFNALNKALKRCEQLDTQAITITKGSLIQVIPFRDILYCEAIGHKIYICTTSVKADYYNTLEALQNILDERFFRCHRSYIINMHYVSSKDGEDIVMVNGDRILVSRRKQQQFSQKLLSFIRNEVL